VPVAEETDVEDGARKASYSGTLAGTNGLRHDVVAGDGAVEGTAGM